MRSIIVLQHFFFGHINKKIAAYTGWPISRYTVIARKCYKNFFIGGIYFISRHISIPGA